MSHTLKIKPIFYLDIISGKKTFEIRKNDRDYKVGDLIKFVDTNGNEFQQVFEQNLYEITYILTHAEFEPIPEDYVVFSIKECK